MANQNITITHLSHLLAKDIRFDGYDALIIDRLYFAQDVTRDNIISLFKMYLILGRKKAKYLQH